MTKKENQKPYAIYKKGIPNPQTTYQVNYNYICDIVNDAMNGIFDLFGFDPRLETFLKVCIDNYKVSNYLQVQPLEEYLFLCVSCFCGLNLKNN